MENIVIPNLYGIFHGLCPVKFVGSDKFGDDYKNDLFARDINNRKLYHFELKDDRNKLDLDGPLGDKASDNQEELEGFILGRSLKE